MEKRKQKVVQQKNKKDDSYLILLTGRVVSALYRRTGGRWFHSSLARHFFRLFIPFGRVPVLGWPNNTVAWMPKPLVGAEGAE